jgi:hypothetical protein
MQPYFLPYIGYWQLFAAADKFVILDDVNYINKGWINRNRILLAGKPHIFTLPLIFASQNKLICDIEVAENSNWQKKFIKTLSQAYGKAPHFESSFALLQKILSCTDKLLVDFTLSSLRQILKLLDLNDRIVDSSRVFKNSHLKAQDRILDICKQMGASVYINPIGGTELYDPNVFKQNGIQLKFLKSNEIFYPQVGEGFVPWLSILDVMMFNSNEEVKTLLNEFVLIEPRQICSH